HRLAELAGNATLFAVGVATQRVQPAETRRHRCLLFRIENRDLALEEIPPGEAQPLEQFGEHEAREEILDRSHSSHLCPVSSRCSRASGSRRPPPPARPASRE